MKGIEVTEEMAAIRRQIQRREKELFDLRTKLNVLYIEQAKLAGFGAVPIQDRRKAPRRLSDYKEKPQ